MLGSILQKFRSSDFSKNTFIIMLGTIFSQFVLIAATPWLSRIYTPDEFGLYGMFIGMAMLLGSAMTLRYTIAIMIAETSEKAHDVVKLCLLLSVCITAILTGVAAVFYAPLQGLLNLKDIGYYLMLLPVYAGVLGINETLFSWLNRNKAYNYISINRIVTSSLTLTTTLLWGYFVDRTAHGLIMGSLVGQGMGTVLLFFRGLRFRPFDFHIDLPRIRAMARQYRSFPIYTLPSEFINIFTNQLPVFMLNSLMKNSAAAGNFSMTNRVLGIPLVFVSNSISEVFRQKAADEYRLKGTCRPLFLKTTGALAAMGIIPFAVLFFFGPQIFTFVLGPKWTQAGEYARVLAPLFCLKFIVSPMTVTFFIAQKQRVDFYIHIAMLTLTAAPFYIANYYYHNTYYALIGFSLAYSLIYLPYFYLSLKFATNEAHTPPPQDPVVVPGLVSQP
ncbi:MAG: hypothetical protein EOO16_24040, partial [Chitinophagaceae bacterium]